MRVIEEKSEGLTRVARMRAETEELAARLTKRLEKLQGQVRLRGFRPGKAPVSHLRKLYGREEMREVVQETLSEGVRDAVADKGWRIVGRPEVEPIGSLDATLDGGAPLEFMVRAEARPDFKLTELRTLTLSNPQAAVTDKDVDEIVAVLVKANPRYEARAAGEAALAGDMVKVDMDARVNGKPFPPGQARDAPVVLGSRRSPEALEDALLGIKLGEARKVSLPLSLQDGAQTMASLTVKAVEVLAPHPAEANDAFAKELGVDSLDALRQAMTERLEGESANASRAVLRRRLMDALDEAHPMDLPERVVAREFEAIWSRRTKPEEETEDATAAAKADYETIAKRRVRLGLVFAEIAAVASIIVGEPELRRALVAEARNRPGAWGEDAEAFARAHPGVADALSAALLEGKVTDYALELAKVEDAPLSREDLMKLAAEGEDAADAADIAQQTADGDPA